MPVLYARSDLVRVDIPAESGGCGNTHSRPVISGAPARVWQLDCPRCTAFLKNDLLWSVNAAKIPLTPDEERVLDQMKEEGARTRAQQEAVEAHISAEKARHELDSQQRQQSAEAERAMLELRLAQMSAEMDRLRSMYNGPQAEAAVRQVAAEVNASYAPKAARQPAEAPQRKVSATTCANCGGPLRKPGSRGPTPKGTCLDCRAAARSAA